MQRLHIGLFSVVSLVSGFPMFLDRTYLDSGSCAVCRWNSHLGSALPCDRSYSGFYLNLTSPSRMNVATSSGVDGVEVEIKEPMRLSRRFTRY